MKIFRRKTLGLVLALLCLQPSLDSSAALPPEYQNAKDLSVMVNFIQANPQVLATLDYIDFRNFRVYYSGRCIAYFGRSGDDTEPFVAGPAAPLEYKEYQCGQEPQR